MEIIVNDSPVRVFKGAQVRHALLKYFSMNHLDHTLTEDMEVCDQYGHLIDLDAPLAEGQHITYHFDDEPSNPE